MLIQVFDLCEDNQWQCTATWKVCVACKLVTLIKNKQILVEFGPTVSLGVSMESVLGTPRVRSSFGNLFL